MITQEIQLTKDILRFPSTRAKPFVVIAILGRTIPDSPGMRKGLRDGYQETRPYITFPHTPQS
jgi:hypothetical protein